MISTIHDDSMINTDRQTRLAPTGVEKISKPLVIDKYNTYMGGVDKSDQLVIYYAFSHSSKKWWKRIFFHMVNAYILYTNSTHVKKMSHLDFRVAVAKGLLEKLPSLLQPPPPALHGQLRLTNVGNHFMEPTTGRPDCKVCSDRSAVIDLQANINKPNYNVSFVREPYVHIHVLRSSTLSNNTNNFIQMFPLLHIPLQNYLQDLVLSNYLL